MTHYRVALAAVVAVVWGAVILFLGYDALLHKYSMVQRGEADGRLVVLMVLFLFTCLISAGMLLWHRLVKGNRSPSLFGLAALQLVGYVVILVFLSGFPGY